MGLQPVRPGDAQWSVAEIPYDAIDRDRVRGDLQLFYVLASASFVEITSDLYTRNLLEYYGDDAEIVAWLRHGWEVEEVQHGLALKRYVETVWPEFAWEAAYRNFYAEYSGLCVVEQLARTRALEMAARCVVETGTSSFYRMLAALDVEPVLTLIANHISTDEVRHYKHFYRYFLRYHERERLGRAAVLRTLLARMNEVDAEDAFYAFKHVFLARNPGAEFQPGVYKSFRQGVRRVAKQHFPYGMAVKMLVKPLGLGGAVGRVMLPVMTAATRHILLR